MDRFSQIQGAHYSAAGTLSIGSKGTSVKQLQAALNTLGVTPKLETTSGIFGEKTKAAVLAKGFSYPVDAETMDDIMAKAYPNIAKANGKFDWNKLLDIGINIWGEKTGAGAGGKPTDIDNLPKDDLKPEDDKILGMSKPVVIVGGVVLVGLIIAGAIVIYNKNKGSTQPAAAHPQLALN